MKITLTMLAWFGLLVTALGTLLSFSSSSTWVNTGQLGSGVGYAFTFFVGVIGTLFALIGAFITRPRYLWIGAIMVGVAYVVSYYGYVVPSPSSVPSPNGHHLDFSPGMITGLLVMLLPGLACIIAGVILRRPPNEL